MYSGWWTATIIRANTLIEAKIVLYVINIIYLTIDLRIKLSMLIA